MGIDIDRNEYIPADNVIEEDLLVPENQSYIVSDYLDIGDDVEIEIEDGARLEVL